MALVVVTVNVAASERSIANEKAPKSTRKLTRLLIELFAKGVKGVLKLDGQVWKHDHNMPVAAQHKLKVS